MTKKRRGGVGRLWQRLRQEGAGETLRYCRRWLLYKAHYHFSDRRYERLEAVPTARFIDGQDLDVGEAMKPHLTSYLATPRLLIQMALKAVGEPLTRFAFVDIGSGLGRALLVASEYPFRRVLGYEISPALHRGAIRNIESLQEAGRACAQAVSINGDAVAADWPSGRCVFFMFNSFDRELTEIMFAKIAVRAQRGVSDYLILSNMKHGDLISPDIFAAVRPRGLAAAYFKLASPYALTIYRTVPAKYRPARRAPMTAREMASA
jgi:SAM-dependent methyltransferase